MSTPNAVGDSFKIIPQNVHEVLTTSSSDERTVQRNTKPCFGDTFAQKQGAVLDDIKHLSYARTVTWNDTGEKTGFGGFLKIVGNILHNFRSLFYSSEAALAKLGRDIQTLKNFGTSETMSPKEYARLKTFFGEIQKINEAAPCSLHCINGRINGRIAGLSEKFKSLGNVGKTTEVRILAGIINSPFSVGEVKNCCDRYVDLVSFLNSKGVEFPDSDIEAFRKDLMTKLEIADGSYADQLEEILKQQMEAYKERSTENYKQTKTNGENGIEMHDIRHLV